MGDLMASTSTMGTALASHVLVKATRNVRWLVIKLIASTILLFNCPLKHTLLRAINIGAIRTIYTQSNLQIKLT